jgi:hypothetical protein
MGCSSAGRTLRLDWIALVTNLFETVRTGRSERKYALWDSMAWTADSEIIKDSQQFLACLEFQLSRSAGESRY